MKVTISNEDTSDFVRNTVTVTLQGLTRRELKRLLKMLEALAYEHA